METLQERLNNLPEGNHLLIVAPVIEHRLTGTLAVGIEKDGTIKVQYEDGQIEERQGSKEILSMDADNPSLFALVGYVQDGRIAI